MHQVQIQHVDLHLSINDKELSLDAISRIRLFHLLIQLHQVTYSKWH